MIKYMLNNTFIISMLIAGIIMLVNILNPRDNTDSSTNRSGMSLYTDSLTGCQYLGNGIFSGLTPRLDKQGNHICGDNNE